MRRSILSALLTVLTLRSVSGDTSTLFQFQGHQTSAQTYTSSSATSSAILVTNSFHYQVFSPADSESCVVKNPTQQSSTGSSHAILISHYGLASQCVQVWIGLGASTIHKVNIVGGEKLAFNFGETTEISSVTSWYIIKSSSNVLSGPQPRDMSKTSKILTVKSTKADKEKSSKILTVKSTKADKKKPSKILTVKSTKTDKEKSSKILTVKSTKAGKSKSFKPNPETVPPPTNTPVVQVPPLPVSARPVTAKPMTPAPISVPLPTNAPVVQVPPQLVSARPVIAQPIALAPVLVPLPINAPVVPPQPTSECHSRPESKTLGLLHRVKNIPKQVVTGQHNDEKREDDWAYYTNLVQQTTGKYPGLWSGDFIYSRLDHTTVVKEAKSQWDAGSIINIMWHACPPRPCKDSPCTDYTCDWDENYQSANIACTWDDNNSNKGCVKGSKLTDDKWLSLISDGNSWNVEWNK
jgi:hypothetical protein